MQNVADRRAFSWWVQAIVLLGALLMGSGAVLAVVNPAMFTGGAIINSAGRVFAAYLFSRNLAMAVLLVWALTARARVPLGTLMLLVAVIQIVDMAVDVYEQRWAIVPGVGLLGVLFAIGANRVLGGPVWEAGSWGASQRGR